MLLPHRPARASWLPLLLPLFAAAALAGCSALSSLSASGADAPDAPIARRVAALQPVDALLLGEQHDASEHHVIERETVEALAARGHLAALALEMAEEGRSTAQLASTATEAQVQAALDWSDKAWPWASYGPAVMAAVRAGVPVVGANLPRSRMKNAMADVSLDVQLNGEAFTAQQDAVRDGHCRMLPESQIVPMTRIQVGRDRAMAQAIVKARKPGQTVLLIAGAGHVVRALGVPQHLPDDVKIATVRLLAAPASAAGPETGDYDRIWRTPPLPEKDYCAEFKRQARPQPKT
ncbi:MULTISPECIES: ChaN family lipoprotein [Variovorax]|uniref:Putative iron-regulated protein n=1 Tax=Variovorax guangxiensis TaxID=1775474 RepID=A0A840G1Q3_9BURK|nr:ChaN family lipoprotein [Variovorax guangxiensis]MBB4225217.1 putative iron-regulated protein [Variovorax guangxiensis]